MTSEKTKIDGQNIVYHYLQKVLLKDEEFSLDKIPKIRKECGYRQTTTMI